MNTKGIMMSKSNDELITEIKKAQALAILAMMFASYRLTQPKAWYEKGIVGDLTYLFR